MTQLKARSHLYVRWIFLRLVSLCFLAAFLSIAVQIVGLYGEHGILPIRNYLNAIVDKLSFEGVLEYPSIFWFNYSDGFLQTTCWVGVVLSLLAVFGIFTGPLLAILWALYLSIVSVGQTFMGFQWDALLLETALLAAWFAPWGFREIHPFDRAKFESQNEVSYLFLWLLRLLCFKLMLFSGICKVAGNEHYSWVPQSSMMKVEANSWHNLTAMTYHYETQPLPTPAAYLAHKLPLFLQKLSTAVLFVIEIGFSASLLTLGRTARIIAACGFVSLMLMIMITGNYAFFNWLTIALSITLVDDDALFAITPRSIRMAYHRRPRRLQNLVRNTMCSLLPAIMIGSVSISFLWMMFDRSGNSIPQFLKIPVALAQPLSSFNSYGLFASMTTSRYEIIVEGSNNGKDWLPYEFKYKPGDLRRAPPIVAPHQPRLDWQMWFAALGPVEESRWFDSFVRSLLLGSPEVLALMDKNPFPQGAPKLIRATLYDYHFSDLNSLLSKGEWWHRTRLTEFFPATSLDQFQE